MQRSLLFTNALPYQLAGMVGLFLFCASLIGCGGSKSATISMDQLEAMSAERFGDTGGCDANADGSLVLCQSAFLAKEAQPGVKFFVYSQTDGQIIYEQTETCESVQWHDNDRVRVTTLSGMVQRNSTDSDNATLIDVKTGHKKADT
ncbi:MAG: hypothetical protein AAF564_14785 [Bacteroidota bacterium]